jgi:RNA polymerase sigma-70 factor (TIGR02943 family)
VGLGDEFFCRSLLRTIVPAYRVATCVCNQGALSEIGSRQTHDVDLRRGHPSVMSSVDVQAAAARWVDQHGECLYRFALMRVRKPEVVEDLVQETFLAAVRGYDKFGGRSSERSWLCGILKNKIVDHFRNLGRETSFTDMEFLSDEFSEKFVSEDFWDHDKGPKEWKPEADVVMHRAEFWQTMGDCLAKLPQKVRDVFTMREMDGVPSKEICSILSITDSNLWVMLHRARMALRECLEMNWFDKPVGGKA